MTKIFVTDPDQEKQPRVEYVFGGRMVSSEYVKIMDERNREVSAHRVRMDLVLTTEQFREFLSMIGKDDPVKVLLIP